jgi:nucleoside-diphosphate-sugar epimerase
MTKIGDVLVTGVSGRASGTLAERMQAGGFRVRALVRTAGQAAEAELNGWVPVRGDLTRPESLPAALAGASVVVHGAAYIGDDWDRSLAVNVDGSRALAEAALAAGVERFVNISSMSVYGEPLPDGMDEDTPMRPDSDHPYVATKARAELALREVQARGLPTVMLRAGAISSPLRSAWGDVIIARIRANGWPARLHPQDVIPWVHTDDLAEMTYLAATHPAAPGHAFVAVDQNALVADLHGRIAEAMGCEITPPDRPPRISRTRIGKIREVLGYSPRHTLEHTVATLVGIVRGVAPVR